MRVSKDEESGNFLGNLDVVVERIPCKFIERYLETKPQKSSNLTKKVGQSTLKDIDIERVNELPFDIPYRKKNRQK